MFQFDESLNSWNNKEVVMFLTTIKGELIEYYGLFQFHGISLILTNDSRKHKSGNGLADFEIQFIRPSLFITLGNWIKFEDNNFNGNITEDSQIQITHIRIETNQIIDFDKATIAELSKSNGRSITLMLEMLEGTFFPPDTFKNNELREMRNNTILTYRIFSGDLDLKPYQIKITNYSIKYPPIADEETDFELVVLIENSTLVAKYYNFISKLGFKFIISGFRFIGNED